jgi:hypothetical protein
MTHFLIATASLLALVATLGLICWMLTINASRITAALQKENQSEQEV